MKSKEQSGFTTTSEGENENSFSFFPSAVGAKARSAFTLIELLVVIAIIGILSSVVLAALSGARESARDTRRQQDMRQIITAIELYRNQNGYVPGRGGPCGSGSVQMNEEGSCIVSEFETVMSSVPTDPLSDESGFYYAYDPSHCDTNDTCDDEGGTIGFNQSETGINDKETSCGSDQNLHAADWNRMICWD